MEWFQKFDWFDFHGRCTLEEIIPRVQLLMEHHGEPMSATIFSMLRQIIFYQHNNTFGPQQGKPFTSLWYFCRCPAKWHSHITTTDLIPIPIRRWPYHCNLQWSQNSSDSLTLQDSLQTTDCSSPLAVVLIFIYDLTQGMQLFIITSWEHLLSPITSWRSPSTWHPISLVPSFWPFLVFQLPIISPSWSPRHGAGPRSSEFPKPYENWSARIKL